MFFYFGEFTTSGMGGGAIDEKEKRHWGIMKQEHSEINVIHKIISLPRKIGSLIVDLAIGSK